MKKSLLEIRMRIDGIMARNHELLNALPTSNSVFAHHLPLLLSLHQCSKGDICLIVNENTVSLAQLDCCSNARLWVQLPNWAGECVLEFVFLSPEICQISVQSSDQAFFFSYTLGSSCLLQCIICHLGSLRVVMFKPQIICKVFV